MKRTYIKPENTVVRIETEQFIADSLKGRFATENGEVGEAREVIQAPDAWEDEW